MKKEIIPSGTSQITRDEFPASKKIYVKGEIHKDIQVAMREVELTESKPTFTDGEFKKDNNPPVTLYDTSGPYTDPNIEIDVRKGIPRVREQWIFDRNDVERLDDISSDYGKERLTNSDLDHLRFEHIKKPLRAKKGHNVSQMYYAKKGIITPEMEYVAIRENQKLQEVKQISNQHAGQSFGAAIPERITAEFVRDEIAKGRAIIPNNINHPESEPMIIGDGSNKILSSLKLMYDYGIILPIGLLSSSTHKSDTEKSSRFPEIKEYIEKPLTEEKITVLFEKYFG